MSGRARARTDIARVRAALPAYDVDDVIGEGGCGVVLAGTHSRLGRRVAIKQMIPPQFGEDPVVRRRFIDEARVMAAIDHPHVVQVFDYVEYEELCLLVMEFMPGGTVGDRFSEDGLDAAAAVAIALSCAAGLDAAHRHGILHRDVKPANLMFGGGGGVKLTDFGIAKIVGGDETLVTQEGYIVGTLHYMSPEQIRGEQLSPAADVYSLATMLYQLLSGKLPIPPTESRVGTILAHARGVTVPLTKVKPSVPEPIADVVMRGLASDSARRFQTAEEFAVALGEPAVSCWGEDWLTSVGIPVVGADTIVAAATGSGRRGSGAHRRPTSESRSGETTFESTRPSAASEEGQSSMPTTEGAPAGNGSPPTLEDVAAARPRSTARLPRVRPDGAVADHGLRLIDIDRDDLVPIQEVVSFDSPRVPLGAAAVLAAAACAVALLGFGGPTAGGSLAPGVVALAGADPVTAAPVELDLSAPIPLRVDGLDADAARLSLDVLGARVGGDTTPITPGVATSVPAPVNPYVLPGTGTGELTLIRDGVEIAVQRVEFSTAQRSTTTAVAVGVVLLALFGIAYLESNFRVLRRGRGGVGNYAGLCAAAAVTAVAVVGAAWVLIGTSPTVPTLVVAATVAIGAGAAAAVGARRMGKRYRHQRGGRRRTVAVVRG
ncbi:serine/threonine-protein kinase [Nocardia bovistercoris]|uniref:non-specific serine/threonine protein kinase n=1 Tax=Nocardia bovistercoris TaxID=2785916 RepID=A0A931I9N2_9NOCA|nr:serine/threonine-protein kinase [Nocardia bovistercoris]MBH0776458.1 serine/threonine protein kinase [Nocardia bovistercoris]